MLSDVTDGHSMIMLDCTTITLDAPGGSVTLQVDGNPNFTGQGETGTNPNFLIVPLANAPGPVMTVLLDQLASGHELRVVTTAETRTFDLSGGSPALDGFGRLHCCDVV